MIAITSSAEKAERLKALGAAAVINYVETPDRHEEIRELTGGKGPTASSRSADRAR